MGGLFAYISRGRIIRDILFSLSLRELIHGPITQEASLLEVKDIMLDTGWDWGKIPFKIPLEVKRMIQAIPMTIMSRGFDKLT